MTMRMHAQTPVARTVVVLATALAVASCGVNRLGDSFSGGASMEVEVEVYKGPLSKEPEVQWGEFEALVGEAAASLTSFNDHVLWLAVNRGYIVPEPDKKNEPLLTIRPHFRGEDPKKEVETRSVAKIAGVDARQENNTEESKIVWCKSPELQKKLVGGIFETEYENCLRLAQLHDDVQHLTKTNQKLKNDLKTARTGSGPVDALETLRQGAELGTQFKVKAFYWAEAQLVDPPDRPTRLFMTGFGNLAAEYGNQIASRADTLLQQCRSAAKDADVRNCTGTPRETLPLSVYLREVNPTEFANLFTYNRATGIPTWEEFGTRPFWELGREETRDRVRVIERLFADHNWSRINTVYASGQGDVRMAFIKDDIGNWNLKSFSNDPTELLTAYKDLARAAVVQATKLVEDIGSGGGSAGLREALSLAGRTARGRVGPPSPTAAGIDLAALESAVGRQLDIVAARRKQVEKDGPAAPADGDTTDFETKKVDIRKQTYNDLRAVLVQYDAMLESLQSAVATSATGDSPGTVDQLDKLKAAAGGANP